jgi:hypothetical protein
MVVQIDAGMLTEPCSRQPERHDRLTAPSPMKQPGMSEAILVPCGVGVESDRDLVLLGEATSSLERQRERSRGPLRSTRKHSASLGVQRTVGQHCGDRISV